MGNRLYYIVITIWAVLLLSYGLIRSNSINKLREHIKLTINDLNSFDIAISKHIENDFIFLDTLSYVEKIFLVARNAKIKHFSVSTKEESRKNQKTSNQRQKNTIININLEDDYRNVAEFVRLIQNMRVFARINRLEMMAGEKGVKASISIELYKKGTL